MLQGLVTANVALKVHLHQRGGHQLSRMPIFAWACLTEVPPLRVSQLQVIAAEMPQMNRTVFLLSELELTPAH